MEAVLATVAGVQGQVQNATVTPGVLKLEIVVRTFNRFVSRIDKVNHVKEDVR